MPRNLNPRRLPVVVLAAGIVASMLGAVSLTQPVSAGAGDSTPDVQTTLIESDGRTISLRRVYTATDAGTSSQAGREIVWTAPSTTKTLDAMVIGGGGGGGGGKAGNHGNSTNPNVRGAGGGGGGGGEVRRDTSIVVTPGEVLSGGAGAGGAAGTGAIKGSTPTAAGSGGDGDPSWLRRSDKTSLLLANGGTGGTGGDNVSGGTSSTGGTGGAGGTGGDGGTLLTAGLSGVNGSNSTTAPSAAAGLTNSGADWLFHGLRLAGGGGGGGGKSSNGGSTGVISPGTTATTGAVYDLTDLTKTVTAIAGNGDGGNNEYVSDSTKNARALLGGGGGGGAFVFSSGRAAGRGGAGGLLLHYPVADLIASTFSSGSSSIPVSSGSTTVTLQLRDADGTATNVSVGPIEMSLSGTNATLGSVTDNGDGTYSVTLTAGSGAGTASVSATVVGEKFTANGSVEIVDPTSTTVAQSTTTVAQSGTTVAPTTTLASTETTETTDGSTDSEKKNDKSGDMPNSGVGSNRLSQFSLVLVAVGALVLASRRERLND